jgi:oxygen-independent coproporphyrinogen-3 oxidase
MYLYAVSTLEAYGYHQYEISNFAKSGRQCQHNLKYWLGG